MAELLTSSLLWRVFGAGAFEQSSVLPGPHVALEPDARVVHPAAGER